MSSNKATRDKQIRKIEGYDNMTALCRGSFEKEEVPSCFRETRRKVNMSLNTQTPPQPSLHVTLKGLPFVHQTKLHAHSSSPSQTDFHTSCSGQFFFKILKDH